MSHLLDEVAGELFYDFGWCRIERVSFFGQECAVKVAFSADQDQPLEQAQRDAFCGFWQSRDFLLREAEAAIFSYYNAIRADLVAKLLPETIDELAPPAHGVLDIGPLVRLDTLFFPEAFGASRRLVGLLADCTWDPALGIAVRFEDEQVVDVGPQDIVL